MTRCSCAAVAALLAMTGVTTTARAQSAAAAPATAQASAPFPIDSLTTFVKAHLAVAQLRDKAQAELAEPKNKKPEEQARIRTRLHDEVVAALRTFGFTLARFDDLTRIVSVDEEVRKAFEGELMKQGAAKS